MGWAHMVVIGLKVAVALIGAGVLWGWVLLYRQHVLGRD